MQSTSSEPQLEQFQIEEEFDLIKEEKKIREVNEGEIIEWFRPIAGKHLIEITEVGKIKTFTFKNGQTLKRLYLKFNDTFKGKVIAKQYNLKTADIKDGQEIPVTTKSLYNKFIKVAKKLNKSKLLGSKFTLLIDGEGKNTTYTIPEIVD